MEHKRISILVLLTCWLLVAAAYWRCGPPGPLGFLPLSLDYGLLGALAAAVGVLGLTYAAGARGPWKLALILLESLGVAGGLFFASLWLPMLVLYGD